MRERKILAEAERVRREEKREEREEREI